MNERVLGSVRTLATLGVLGLLFLYAVSHGIDAVSKPFPKGEPTPNCVDKALSAGDILRPGGITVNVINAGTKSGKARATLDDLEDYGFDGAEVSNRPDDKIRSVEIHVAGGKTPAARLVRTYLGGSVRVVDDPSMTEGVTVIVGDAFAGARKGRAGIRITEDATVCSPTELR